MLCLVTATECFVCELQPRGFNLLSADTHIRRDGPAGPARLQAPKQHRGDMSWAGGGAGRGGGSADEPFYGRGGLARLPPHPQAPRVSQWPAHSSPPVGSSYPVGFGAWQDTVC